MSTWNIDPAHTDVHFAAKHMMVSTATRGEIRVRAASVETGFAQRDAHLRSVDFFDAERYPEIVFRATRVDGAGTGFRVTGDLTIRDVTWPVTFDVEVGGIVPGMSGARHVGLAARTRIDREAWGLTWNVGLEAGGWLVGKEIRLEIEVAADEVAALAPVARATAAA